MENIRIKFYYESPETYENNGSKGIYINQNLRTSKNGKSIRISSQDVITSLVNDVVADKLLSAKKELLFDEKVIQYIFTIKLDDTKTSTIELNIPTRIKEGIYSELVRNDIEKFDKLTQLGKKEDKINKTNKIIAALIGLGIALGTAYSFKTAIDYEKEEHANAGDKLRSEYSFMDDSEYEEMIQKGKEIWKINQSATSKTYTKK